MKRNGSFAVEFIIWSVRVYIIITSASVGHSEKMSFAHYLRLGWGHTSLSPVIYWGFQVNIKQLSDARNTDCLCTEKYMVYYLVHVAY